MFLHTSEDNHMAVAATTCSARLSRYLANTWTIEGTQVLKENEVSDGSFAP